MYPTATYTYGGGSAYERSTLTATNVCMREVYLQRSTPRWKHFLAWNEITAENHCTAEVHLQSRPTISMFFDCNYSNGNGYTKATTASESGKPTKIAFIYCGRLDVKELGLELIVMRLLIATLDEIQPHRITIKSSVTLQPSPAYQINIYIDTLLV